MRLRMTDEREDRFRRMMQASGENTKAGAIDVAMKHYLTDLSNKQRVIDHMDPQLAEELHTPYIPLEVTVDRNVGHNDE